jgi:hypothetical protein
MAQSGARNDPRIGHHLHLPPSTQTSGHPRSKERRGCFVRVSMQNPVLSANRNPVLFLWNLCLCHSHIVSQACNEGGTIAPMWKQIDLFERTMKFHALHFTFNSKRRSIYIPNRKRTVAGSKNTVGVRDKFLE